MNLKLKLTNAIQCKPKVTNSTDKALTSCKITRFRDTRSQYMGLYNFITGLLLGLLQKPLRKNTIVNDYAWWHMVELFEWEGKKIY